MSFSEKKIRRSIREFGDLTQNILQSNYQLYQDRIGKFVRFIKKDEVINIIIDPFLKMNINETNYINETQSGWSKLTLPKSKDKEIAFILGILVNSVEQGFEMENWGFNIFHKKSRNETIYLINEQIHEPVFKEILNRINDLIEDEVEGKEEVDESNLTIINVESIKATNSNVAIGSNIEQKNIGTPEKIVKELIESGISFDKIQSVSDKIESFTKEAQKDNPDESKLKKFFQPIFDVGKQVAVSVFIKVFTDPTVTSAIHSFVH